MAKIVVVDYDPAWPETFANLRDRIWPSICDTAIAIEHVGSTSVPGLAAKPIIDMTIVVPDEAAMRTVIDRLAMLGYRHQGDLGIPGRESFIRPPDTPSHHLYACVAGNDGLRNHLTVRDHLRNDPSAARAYGDLKKHLAQRFADDIDAYVDGKTEFILSILARANFSTEQMEQIRAINTKSDTAL